MKIHFVSRSLNKQVYSLLDSAKIICPLLDSEMFLYLQEGIFCNQVTNWSLSRGEDKV